MQYCKYRDPSNCFQGVLMSVQDEHKQQRPIIMNCADYVDALLRPPSNRYHIEQQKIAGRRLRDRYLEEVKLTRLVRDET